MSLQALTFAVGSTAQTDIAQKEKSQSRHLPRIPVRHCFSSLKTFNCMNRVKLALAKAGKKTVNTLNKDRT